jgi:hypothetical protein
LDKRYSAYGLGLRFELKCVATSGGDATCVFREFSCETEQKHRASKWGANQEHKKFCNDRWIENLLCVLIAALEKST